MTAYQRRQPNRHAIGALGHHQSDEKAGTPWAFTSMIDHLAYLILHTRRWTASRNRAIVLQSVPLMARTRQ